jgi:hypothetical protein
MDKPKACTCGGLFKKVASPANARDGSRYFKCDRCGNRIEQTSNGYEFKDGPLPVAPRPVVVPVPAPPPERRPW